MKVGTCFPQMQCLTHQAVNTSLWDLCWCKGLGAGSIRNSDTTAVAGAQEAWEGLGCNTAFFFFFGIIIHRTSFQSQNRLIWMGNLHSYFPNCDGKAVEDFEERSSDTPCVKKYLFKWPKSGTLTNTKRCGGCGAIGKLIHAGGNAEMVRPLWKAVRGFLQK